MFFQKSKIISAAYLATISALQPKDNTKQKHKPQTQSNNRKDESLWRNRQRPMKLEITNEQKHEIKWKEELQYTQVFEDVTPVDVTATPEKPEGTVRVVFISDTHNYPHTRGPRINIPDGDILLHAGDFTEKGTVPEISNFVTWFDSLPHKHKVVIAGNHDKDLCRAYLARQGKTRLDSFPAAVSLVRDKNLSFTYLHNESVEIMGLKIYGTPHGPYPRMFGFGRARGLEAQTEWNNIPDDADIVMVHTPPLGRGDLCFHGSRVGDEQLLYAIQERVKPQVCVFGHVHEGFGITSDGVTKFVNAALGEGPQNCTEHIDQQPIVLDVPVRGNENASNGNDSSSSSSSSK